MSKITRSAQGQQCQVRMPGICNGNPETVVFAHYRLAGSCGTGIKPSDLLGAYACSACHDEADRRTTILDVETAHLYHAEGVLRTQLLLNSQHLIQIA